MLNPAQTDIGL